MEFPGLPYTSICENGDAIQGIDDLEGGALAGIGELESTERKVSKANKQKVHNYCTSDSAAINIRPPSRG